MSINKDGAKNVFVGMLVATEFAAGAALATLMALGTLKIPTFLSQKPAQMLFQMAVATLLVATFTLASYNATKIGTSVNNTECESTNKCDEQSIA